MKSLIVSFIVLLSNVAFAGSKVVLSPGASVTVNASDATVVSCEGAESSSGHFCSCGGLGFDDKTLVRIDFVSGNKIAFPIHSYVVESDCILDLKSSAYPACR